MPPYPYEGLIKSDFDKVFEKRFFHQCNDFLQISSRLHNSNRFCNLATGSILSAREISYHGKR